MTSGAHGRRRIAFPKHPSPPDRREPNRSALLGSLPAYARHQSNEPEDQTNNSDNPENVDGEPDGAKEYGQDEQDEDYSHADHLPKCMNRNLRPYRMHLVAKTLGQHSTLRGRPANSFPNSDPPSSLGRAARLGARSSTLLVRRTTPHARSLGIVQGMVPTLVGDLTAATDGHRCSS